jgi:hypothetical protein
MEVTSLAVGNSNSDRRRFEAIVVSQIEGRHCLVEFYFGRKSVYFCANLIIRKIQFGVPVNFTKK